MYGKSLSLLGYSSTVKSTITPTLRTDLWQQVSLAVTTVCTEGTHERESAQGRENKTISSNKSVGRKLASTDDKEASTINKEVSSLFTPTLNHHHSFSLPPTSDLLGLRTMNPPPCSIPPLTPGLFAVFLYEAVVEEKDLSTAG